jgi:hypothetical protein
MDERKQAQLKKLPGVDRILEYGPRTYYSTTFPNRY